jgi:hypothetical protein
MSQAKKKLAARLFKITGLFILFCCVLSHSMEATVVEIREELITLPTYEAGPLDPNPIFYFGRAYQGAQGRVYPYPLMDKLTTNKVERKYKILYVENEFVRVGVLPEIGGRIFEAVDKTNGYDFFYRQHVIKPALIGMLGAWISGGGGAEHSPPSPGIDLHAGRLYVVQERRRQQDDLGW